MDDFRWLDVLVRRLFAAGALGAVGLLAVRSAVAVISGALERSRLEKAAHTLIRSLVRVVLDVLLGLAVASALGIDVTGVVALASVLTLAVSLALQNILANIIGGFTILSTHPFHTGDYVEIAGQSGTVTEINLTYTELLTPDQKKISIPNSSVTAAQIVNDSSSETRRISIDVSASYDAPTQTVLDALIQAGAVDKVLAYPAPKAVILEFGEGSIRYSLRLWVRNGDYWEVYFRVMESIRAVFEEQGVDAPGPRLNIHLNR